jgi:hypothetical protein
MRFSKPVKAEIYDLFREHIKHDNVTIRVADKFDIMGRRLQRKVVGNPNVYYIYAGYEPERYSRYSAFEAISGKHTLFGTKLDRFNRIVPEDEDIIIDANNNLALAKNKTIWIPCNYVTHELLTNINDYIANPKEYLDRTIAEALKTTYNSILTANLQDLEKKLARKQELINDMQGTLNVEMQELEANQIIYNATKSYLDDFTKFAKDKVDKLRKHGYVKNILLDVTGKLSIFTKPIIAYGRGDYPIIIPELTIVIYNKQYWIQDPASLYKGYNNDLLPHPHFITKRKIDDKEVYKACLGSIEKDIDEVLVKRNDIFETATILLEYLQNYNAGDPAGRAYTSWPRAQQAV